MSWFRRQLHIFRLSISTIWEELVVSLSVVILISIGLGYAFYLAEHDAQPTVFKSFGDTLLWAYARYIESGDDVFNGCPVTPWGTFITSVFGFMGLAIVIIPTGLIASGFEEANNIEKREKQLEEQYQIITKGFKKLEDRNLKEHLAKLPQNNGEWYSGIKFKVIPNNISVAKFRLRSITLDDVIDICNKYKNRGLRIKNTASAQSLEDGKEDRFMIEYFPVNTEYGCFIDRKSKITIVSTNSRTELGIGNFSYYLAKFAGFNYISKDFDIDEDEPDSYYNVGHTKVNGYTEAEHKKLSKSDRAKFQKKDRLKGVFLKDLESLCQTEDSWVFCLLSQTKNLNNTIDVHISHSSENGENDTIHDHNTYNALKNKLIGALHEEFKLIVEESSRYPLVNRPDTQNLAYKLQADGCQCNSLTLRVSSKLLAFDSNMRVIQFVMAKTIKDTLAPNSKIRQEDIDDLNNSHFGWSESKT